jgi:hypothetical protein
MGPCLIRTGFLTLRDCGNSASTLCTTCSRPACATHLSASSGFTLCLECAAGQQVGQESADVGESETYDDAWAYRYRSHYYNRGYQPIYTGTTDYDGYDVRAFDSDVNDTFVDDDTSSTASFGDS